MRHFCLLSESRFLLQEVFFDLLPCRPRLAVCQMTDYGVELNLMPGDAAGPMPNHLRLARDFMHREARNNPSMVAVARAANISVRTLETSFRQHMDVTPHAYLRTLRLKMAREALSDASDMRPIAEVAADHGFPHAGRFAQYYTQLFGESPSQTRRKGPGAG